MGKKIILILTICVFTLNVSAQRKNFDLEKFKKERAEFFINEIGLTDTESKKFIPLADELLAKKFELNRETRKKARELTKAGNISNEEYDKLNTLIINNKIKEAQLDKEYYLKFKSIITPEKIYKFHRAESKFMQRTVQNKQRNQNK